MSINCKNCLKFEKGKCTVFVSSHYQWRKGKCFGYVDNPSDMLKMYKDMYEYNLKKGIDSTILKNRVDYYNKLCKK